MVWNKGGGCKKEICRESRGRLAVLELESCLPFQKVLNKNRKLISGDFNFQ